MTGNSMSGKSTRALLAMHPGELLREDAPVTPAMALKLGKLCGNGPRLWINLQRDYDLEKAAKQMKAELAEIPTLKAVA